NIADHFRQWRFTGDSFGSDRRHLHLTEPGAYVGGETRVGRNRREFRCLVVADFDAGIGHRPVGRGDHVAGTQRSIEREIDRREAHGVAAVASAVGAQRLAVNEGVFAVGITLAGRGRGIVDAAAEENLGGARRTKRLAHLHRRRAATRQRKILAVAAAYAICGSAARGGRPGRGWLVLTEWIGEKVRLWR